MVELPEAVDPGDPDAGDGRSLRGRRSRTSTCWSSTSPPASSCTRRPAIPRGTLAQALAGRAAGGRSRGGPGIVHRLDRDTSGLMVVAKSEPVHRALQELIRARELEREYLALVEGRPDARSGTIDAPIGRDRRHRKLVSVRSDSARGARTHFEVEEAYPRTTLLRVRLETGRTHQIRAHMAAIGHPICGDRQYGGSAQRAPTWANAPIPPRHEIEV